MGALGDSFNEEFHTICDRAKATSKEAVQKELCDLVWKSARGVGYLRQHVEDPETQEGIISQVAQSFLKNFMAGKINPENNPAGLLFVMVMNKTRNELKRHGNYQAHYQTHEDWADGSLLYNRHAMPGGVEDDVVHAADNAERTAHPYFTDNELELLQEAIETLGTKPAQYAALMFLHDPNEMRPADRIRQECAKDKQSSIYVNTSRARIGVQNALKAMRDRGEELGDAKEVEALNHLLVKVRAFIRADQQSRGDEVPAVVRT